MERTVREGDKGAMKYLRRTTLNGKLIEHEVKGAFDQAEFDQAWRRTIRQLDLDIKEKADRAEKRSSDVEVHTKDASKNTSEPLELKDVSERFHF